MARNYDLTGCDLQDAVRPGGVGTSWCIAHSTMDALTPRAVPPLKIIASLVSGRAGQAIYDSAKGLHSQGAAGTLDYTPPVRACVQAHPGVGPRNHSSLVCLDLNTCWLEEGPGYTRLALSATFTRLIADDDALWQQRRRQRHRQRWQQGRGEDTFEIAKQLHRETLQHMNTHNMLASMPHLVRDAFMCVLDNHSGDGLHPRCVRKHGGA